MKQRPGVIHGDGCVPGSGCVSDPSTGCRLVLPDSVCDTCGGEHVEATHALRAEFMAAFHDAILEAQQIGRRGMNWGESVRSYGRVVRIVDQMLSRVTTTEVR